MIKTCLKCFSCFSCFSCFNSSEIDTELKEINYNDTQEFIPPIKYGKVISVYDGDTITIAGKLPYKESPIYRFKIRLSGIDSPEIRSNNSEEKEMAKIVKDKLNKKINGKIIELKNNKNEKYGRILANVWLDNEDINEWMLKNRYAIEYKGKTKVSPKSWKNYIEKGIF